MTGNMFADFPHDVASRNAESFETLLTHQDVRIERIISTGQSSPPDFWYCQPQSEWVMLMQGSAGLRLEHEPDERVLQAGDFMNIPAYCKHRVEWTDAKETTIWLAIHYGDEKPVNKAGEVSR